MVCNRKEHPPIFFVRFDSGVRVVNLCCFSFDSLSTLQEELSEYH